jgi:hypothetical protein
MGSYGELNLPHYVISCENQRQMARGQLPSKRSLGAGSKIVARYAFAYDLSIREVAQRIMDRKITPADLYNPDTTREKAAAAEETKRRELEAAERLVADSAKKKADEKAEREKLAAAKRLVAASKKSKG